MTHYVLQTPKNLMPEALDEIPRYKCDTCGAIKLSHELEEHAISHESDKITLDARTVLRRD